MNNKRQSEMQLVQKKTKQKNNSMVSYKMNIELDNKDILADSKGKEIKNISNSFNNQSNPQISHNNTKSKTKNDNKPLKTEKQEENNVTFEITKKHINELFSIYEARKFDEEIVRLQLMGGQDKVCSLLKTSSENGIISNSTIPHRIKYFDSNSIKEEKPKHFCLHVWETFDDLMLRILLLSAILQIGIGVSPLSPHQERDWIDGFSILIAVAIVVLVSSITNYAKQNKFISLKEKNLKLVTQTVKREGEIITLNSKDLLVGDLVRLQVGCNIPADGLLVNGSEIKINESSLTGETDLIDKETHSICLKLREKERLKKKLNNFDIFQKNKLPSCLLWSGTNVEYGQGWMIVLAVGKNSSSGKILESVLINSENQDKTPLEIKLDILARRIGKFGIIFASLTFISLLIRFGIVYSEQLSNYENKVSDLNPKNNVSNEIFNIVLLVVSVLVVAIPEGLPLAVTLSLAFSVQKMMNDKNLVRHLSSCETMGNASYICTDKTGTLTKNKMTVNTIYNCLKSINIKEICCDENNRINPADLFQSINKNEISSAKHSDNDSFLNEKSSIKEDSIINTNRQNEEYKSNNIIAEDFLGEIRKTQTYIETTSSRFNNFSWFEYLTMSIALNLEMEIDQDDNTTNASKTDLALFNFLHNFNVKVYPFIEEFLSIENSRKLPFSSSRKKKSTLVKNDDFPTRYRLFIKGASEIMIEKSISTYLCPKSITKKPFNKIKDKCMATIIKYADETLRTICIGYKDITETEFNLYKSSTIDGSYDIEEDNITLIALIGIRDVLRDNVKEAVDQCHSAGIKVVMITGDNINTAMAISKECNIIEENESLEGIAMNGLDFYNKVEGLECGTCFQVIKECKCPLTAKEAEFRGIDKLVLRKEKIKNMKVFEEIMKSLKVLARSRPIDKYALVIGLKAMNNIVAVTGDGTNDAQALSTSDIGFAMGIQGTDIAKDAADIIILDDDFSSIIKAVVWGRNIYDNIRKFVQFQLTVNISACILVFITSVVSNKTAISPIQMLWINLIIDSLGSLALATQEPNSSILKRNPYKKTESLINIRMWKHIIFQSIVLLTLTLIIFFNGANFIPEDNLMRHQEGRIIKQCYGIVPGQSIDSNEYIFNSLEQSYHIISGISSDWPSSILLKSNMSSLQCGDYSKESDLSAAYIYYLSTFSNTVHMTMIFNIFVIFTMFNQINARVIDNSLNIFKDIAKSSYYLVIIIIEIILHILIVQFGTHGFNTAIDGLTFIQWMICFGFGMISLISDIIIKLLNIDNLIESVLRMILKRINNKVLNFNENNEDVEEDEVLRIRAYTHSLQNNINKIRRTGRESDSFDTSLQMMEDLKHMGNII